MTRISFIKIAVLLPSMHVGGAERLVLQELLFLKDDPRFNFELHLVFDKGPFCEPVAAAGIPVHVWKAPHKSIRMLKTYMDIVRYLRRNNIDILHSHLLDGIGPIIGILAGARVVATVHNDTRYSAFERFVLNRSDLALGCGKQVLENIRNFIPPDKVNVLNNAISKPTAADYNRKDILHRFGIEENAKVALSLGRLTKQKGFDCLISAFRIVVESVPDAVLLICGEGEDRGMLTELVRSEKLEAHVRLPGVISEINDVLATCDMYVNSSRWEGLPMTLLETMAHGKPIVATDVGGNSEVVHDEITGLIVPPENPEKLAEAIIKLLQDKELCITLGNAALNLFNCEYTIDKHCATLSDYYLRAMNNQIRPMPIVPTRR